MNLLEFDRICQFELYINRRIGGFNKHADKRITKMISQKWRLSKLPSFSYSFLERGVIHSTEMGIVATHEHVRCMIGWKTGGEELKNYNKLEVVR